MRKGFDGLYGLVRDQLLCDPLSGHVFLFSNAQRNRLKIIFFDGTGLWVCAKRIEKGRVHWPAVDHEQRKVVLSHEELTMLLGGIDLAQTRERKWVSQAPRGGIIAVTKDRMNTAQVTLDIVSYNVGIQQYLPFNARTQEIFRGCPEMKGGYLRVSEKPGGGIEIDEKEAAKSPFTPGRGNFNGGWGEVRKVDGTVIKQ
jgi:transposase